MTFAYWCVLLVAILPIVWAGFAKYGAKNFDNARPRIFLENLSGRRQRANWAQANSYEAFPPFAAAVIIASLTGANQAIVDALAGLFVVARILHGLFYIADKSTPRSLAWSFGFLAVIGIFLSAAWLS
jgi:uncharacterized MAPEG superfamily protein